jgi:hypothetical protein
MASAPCVNKDSILKTEVASSVLDCVLSVVVPTTALSVRLMLFVTGQTNVNVKLVFSSIQNRKAVCLALNSASIVKFVMEFSAINVTSDII